MPENDVPKKEKIGSLRRLVSGEEFEEEAYFNYSATLRIFGNEVNFEEIEKNLGIISTSKHKAGERKGPKSPPSLIDMWMYQPNIDENEKLEVHIFSLWNTIKHKKEYLLGLKEKYKVDVFLGYRSNVDTAGIEIPYTALEIFTELKIPFGVSIIIT